MSGSFSWRRWWQLEKMVIADAWEKSSKSFLKVRQGIVVGITAVGIATYIFRHFVDFRDLLVGVIATAVIALAAFVWRVHCAVPHIFQRQADEIDRLRELTSPKVALSYDPASCYRETFGFLPIQNGSMEPARVRMLYVSVLVSGPASAAISSTRVFLHSVDRKTDDGRYISVGIEGGPSLEWTRSDNPSEDSHTPKDLGAGHTRLVNACHVIYAQTPKLLLCVRQQLNREFQLLDAPGIYRFVIRANCAGFGSYTELALLISWGGPSGVLTVEDQ